MRGPQSMKLGLDLTRTNTPKDFQIRSIRYPHRPHERFSRRMRTKISEFRQIPNYVARMRGPQLVKLALDLTRTKY